VIDVIKLAGGLTNNADTSVINLSKKIKDEMVIVIYSHDEVNDFINTYKKEELLSEKCKTASTVTNDACISKEDRQEVNVSVNNDKVTNNSNKMISINYATKEELMTLSGIGEAKALSIIKYREENGLFTNIEDLKNISGIGDKMFDKIKDSITL
jgi:competence protein ComEA